MPLSSAQAETTVKSSAEFPSDFSELAPECLLDRSPCRRSKTLGGEAPSDIQLIFTSMNWHENVWLTLF